MQTRARRRPIVPLALSASLLAAVLTLFSPLAASAHDGLIASSPEAGGTVETLPSQLTLTFSADLITGDGATEVVVTDGAGTSVTDGPAVVDGAVVTQPLVAEAPAGEYHVVWKVVSSDGHPTSDEFFFTVAADSVTTAPPTTEPTTSAPTETIAPSPTTSAEPLATQDPEPAASDAPAIWIVSIIGALAVAALVVWLLIRSRRNTAATDSGPSAER